MPRCTNGSGATPHRPAARGRRAAHHGGRAAHAPAQLLERAPAAATPNGSPCTTTPCRPPRDEVADVTRARYPDLDIPYHSRWRHFEAGGVDRRAELDTRLAVRATPPARARAMIDLAVVSVLLDAGAGAGLALRRGRDGQRFTRSEGPGRGELPRLRYRAVLGRPGAIRCRSTPAGAARADHRPPGRRASRSARTIRWSGLDGRVALLRRLGERCRQPDVFGAQGAGTLFDVLDRRRTARCRCPRHPVAAAGVAVGHLAGGEHHRRSAARRLLAPPGGRRAPG